jgi:hypothetical protein
MVLDKLKVKGIDINNITQKQEDEGIRKIEPSL